MEVYFITICDPKIEYTISPSSYKFPDSAITFFDRLSKHTNQAILASDKAVINYLKSYFQSELISNKDIIPSTLALYKSIIFILEKENLELAIDLINKISHRPIFIVKKPIEGHVLS